MRHLRTVVAALVLVFTGSLAQAFAFPPDAEFIVTDAQGVIVALGRAVGGTAVAMDVWSGFEGPARLTLFLPDGTTRAIDVAIEDGVVAVDGIDLREVRMESVQRQLGLVFQETFLFIGSVRDNILFANPRASEEEI
ncbi:MAG: hypothetical protein P1P87_03310, partial [Trueperaceae bacterium]|nr:hypothetical protein [Trueperaceae bacterium]